jgi:hypothetical protein
VITKRYCSSSVKKFSFFIAALIIGLLSALQVSAQKISPEKKENKTHRKKIEKRHQKDSVWEKDLNIFSGQFSKLK